MKIIVSDRVNAIGSYAFADVDNIVEQLKKEGIEPIDFGVGDPSLPTPELIRNACKDGIDRRKSSGYPSYIGLHEYRETVAWWSKKRFKIDLDPDGKIVKELTEKLNKEVHPISAVTGSGIKELSEFLWQKVKELKSLS